MLQRQGIYYVFFEDFCRRMRRGRISVLTLDEAGHVSDSTPVLERDYHLSYPFVFEWEGEVYMIPETGARKTVELYRCVRFPDRWEHQMNLMEGVHHVDTTLHFDGQRWWMFAALAEIPRGSHSDEAVLFHADDFRTQQWTPHPENPIVGEVTAARPAGAIFRHGDRLYRPTQDCSRHYGYGFHLCHIEQLSPTEYRQSVVSSVTPAWHPDVISTHSFHHVGRLTIIDAEVRTWRWKSWARYDRFNK